MAPRSIECLLDPCAASLSRWSATYRNDNMRTGQELSGTPRTPRNVNAAMFGKLFTLAVDGKVDAQPLVVPGLTIPKAGVHNVLDVGTEHDSLFAFDADTGAKYWQTSLLKAGETTSDDRNCSQVVPERGITATPVIDRASGRRGLTARSTRSP